MKSLGYRKFVLSIAIASILATNAFAQPPEIASDPNYASVYAARKMAQLDSNRDGRFEKSESERLWRAMKAFDRDRDGVLTLSEIQSSKISYLDCPGPKKLNFLYKQTTEEDLHLDIYYPADQFRRPLPTVIYTHGGGWVTGSKHGITTGSFKTVYTQLLQQGFCVVAVNYRLFRSEGTVSIRDCVVDCKDAVRYLSKHSVALGVDPQQFFVNGDSAGGQLAQMLLLSPPEALPGDPALNDASYRMVAGVSWYGPCDFEKSELFNHDGRPDFRDRFGDRILAQDSRPEQKLQRYREVSPVNYLNAASPPLLMIQGDQDETIPVHHANYMKERAEMAGAPVEILIVKNAGHNWRQAGGPIKPDRNSIIQRTVDFLTSHLKSKSTAQATQSGTHQVAAPVKQNFMPAFSWDTIPRYAHIRKVEKFTEEELEYLATFPLITLEKTTGSKSYGSTERGSIEAARAIKRINPNSKVLFYRNVLVHYGGYQFDEDLSKIRSPFLENKSGQDKLVRGRVQAYDLSNPQIVDWWVTSMAEVCNDDSIDGLFLDGNIKVLSSYLQNELPSGKKQQVIDGFEQMITQTRQALKPGKLMIANILRARFRDGGMEHIGPFDGSYLEGFEHPVAGMTRADYVAKGIQTARKAAEQGKVIAMTLNINRSRLDANVDEQSSVLASIEDVSQERLNYCVALFLIIAERYSYLDIHDGYDVNPKDERGAVSKLWLHTFPQYTKPLGPPKGPPKQDGYRYTREFEHASVKLDIESATAEIQWK